MVAGRPDEGEPAALGGGDRRAGREQRRLEARLRHRRVGVEPRVLGRRAHALDVLGRVAAEDRLDRCRLGLRELERLEQRGEPRLRLRVLPRRVQLRECGMAQDVDRTAAASSSSDRCPCARPTR